MKKKWRLRRNEGQSLVEVAMTLPLLLLMFVGLIEIGAALRDYLIVVNANREGTRFAARGYWFESEENREEIFNRVIAAAGVEQRGGNLVQFLRPEAIGELPENTCMSITYVQVPAQAVFLEDGVTRQLVDQPASANGPWSRGTCPDSPTAVEIDLGELEDANRAFNEKYCVAEPLLDQPSADDFVIVEIWFEHEQLLKVPIFGFLPDEFTLYSRSQMRVTYERELGGGGGGGE
jgi:hypothetical protein